MAVRTPHIALLDFSLDARKRSRLVNEFGHVLQLPRTWAVIKVQTPDVALAAIDAGVLEQVGDNPYLVPAPLLFGSIRRRNLVTIAVLNIPSPAAIPTPRLSSVLRTPHDVEGGEGLQFLARRT
jgi:hypothetical protein